MRVSVLYKKAPVFGAFFIASIFTMHNTNAQSLREQLNKEEFILCAHRGGMYADYAENSLRTLEFLEKSFNGSSVMAEVDVRKSKDGTLFLLHDNTLERTTTGSGKIEDSTDEYLKTLKLRKTNGDVTDEKIPTLADLLDFVAKRKIFVMLDVKIDDFKQILDLVKSKNATDKCLVLTFKPANSRKVHELSPDILVSCLVKDRNDWNEISKIVSKESLMAYINASTPGDVVKEMKRNNIPLVTDASEATRNNSLPFDSKFYNSLDVNVLVTDLPVEVRELKN